MPSRAPSSSFEHPAAMSATTSRCRAVMGAGFRSVANSIMSARLLPRSSDHHSTQGVTEGVSGLTHFVTGGASDRCRSIVASGRAGTVIIPTKRERIPHIDDPQAVGRRLLEARSAARLSQRALAFPGCSAAYISRVERGERIPSLQVLRELALRCDVNETFLAWGRRERFDAVVAESVRSVRAAETSGSRAERAAAYAELARVASRAAKALRA
jgi:transcriptional regulator with XRE-family HTH domain